MKYETLGRGQEHVIMVHGWLGTGDRGGWGDLLDHLDTEHFRWALFNVRGYGVRRRTAGKQTIDESARDVISLADHLGWETFSLVGHSMGGAIIQKVLTLAPERVNSLVGIAPTASVPTPLNDRAREVYTQAVEDPGARFAIVDHVTGNRHPRPWVNQIVEHSLETIDHEAFGRAYQAWVSADFAEEVRGATVPVLVVHGEHDPAAHRQWVEKTWGKLFPNAQILGIADVGHYPMFEAPEELGTVIVRFLAEVTDAEVM